MLGKFLFIDIFSLLVGIGLAALVPPVAAGFVYIYRKIFGKVKSWLGW